MNFISAIAIISIMSMGLPFKAAATASSQPTPAANPLRTAHTQQVDARQLNAVPFGGGGGGAAESFQIDRPDGRELGGHSAISSSPIVIRTTDMARLRRAPTTTVRPSHGQIPRPAIISGDDPNFPLDTWTRSLF